MPRWPPEKKLGDENPGA